MSDLLNNAIVLKLNANWQRIGWTTPKKAFIDMCGGVYGGTPPALAISVTLDENGELVEAIPLKWAEWVKLPVRDCDLSVSTHRGAIRCPTILVAPNYAQMPIVVPKMTKEGILARDGFRDQYTGEEFPRSQLNIDHVIPKSRGGKATWENLVACHKNRNFTKGNKLNAEAGLSLIRKPQRPKAVPKSFTIREAKRPEHIHFIK